MKGNEKIKEFFKQFPIQLQQDDDNLKITEFYEFGIIIKNVRKKLEDEIWKQYRWKNEYVLVKFLQFLEICMKNGKNMIYIFLQLIMIES